MALRLRRRCLLCTDITHDGWLCPTCSAALPRCATHCPTCPRPVADPGIPCGGCLIRPPPYDALYGIYRYADDIRTIILQAKYGHDRGALNQLCLWIKQNPPNIAAIDCIVPMPIAWRRLLQRGFNQTHYLGKAASDALAVPYYKGCLRKAERPPQSSLSHDAARQKNARDAFKPGTAAPIQQRHVLLLDDVLTSGASVRAAAGVLRTMGAARISVLVIAMRQK